MKALFMQHGVRIEAPANYRISLHKRDAVWLLEKGAVILFAVQRKGPDQEGRRTMLTNASEGQLLFNIHWTQDFPYEIFAFSEEPIVIWEIETSKLASSICASQEKAEEFSRLLESWLCQFSGFLATPMELKPDFWVKKEIDTFLDKGAILSLKPSELPSEKERLFWIELSEGEIKLLGPHELKITAEHSTFPFLPYLNFLTLSQAGFNVKSTVTLVREKRWCEGLLHFHAFLGGYLLRKQAKTEQEELKRFEEKEFLQDETLHETLTEMVSVLSPADTPPPTKSTDPLFQVCLLIGKEIGIEFQLPDRRQGPGATKETLERVAEDSEARIRPVKLGSLWWKFDSGPLLAFHGKDRRPVALIQNRRGNYELHDPARGSKRKVDFKLAREVQKEAFCFYKVIPDEVQSGKKAFSVYLRGNMKEFGKLALYGLIAALIALFPPIAIALLFNNAIPNANLSLLMQLSIGLIVAALSSSIFIYFRSLILGRIEGQASAQIQPALWDRLLKLPANFFRRFSAGDLLLRVMSMEQMRPLFSSNAARIILTGVFSIFYLIAMAIYSFKLTLIGVGLLLIALLVTFFCACAKIRLQKKVFELQGKINGALVQILSGVSKLRVAGAENNAFSYWASLFAKTKHFEMKAQHIQNIVTTVMAAFPLFAFIGIFAAVMHMEEAGTLSIGAFLAFNTAFMTLATALYDLNNTVLQVAPIIPLWGRSKVIVEEPQEILLKRVHPGKLNGDIRIDGVSFGYDKESPLVLSDVSIRVHPHEMVGIVGPSGSGKSTLIRLLLGFETPRSGAVYFNGKDLSHLNVHDVRKQMGVVLQGGGIVAGTLYQNIVAGGRYSQEQVDRAIKLSSFDRDLNSFPMGLHTVVPMNGETLSGGQKQRLLIARALLPNPKILIFDEATSALDNKSQDEITHNINELDITRIVIAHRLSTIRNADRIYVIEGGKVSQAGTFQKLAEQEGLFSEMLKRQKL